MSHIEHKMFSIIHLWYLGGPTNNNAYVNRLFRFIHNIPLFFQYIRETGDDRSNFSHSPS